VKKKTMIEWFCEDCFDKLNARSEIDYAIKTIPNAMKKPCIFCGKLAKHLTVMTTQLRVLRIF